MNKRYLYTGLLVIGIVIALSLLGLLAVAVWYLRRLLLYILVAAILSMILHPVGRLLERIRFGKKKLPRSLRAVAQLLCVYVVLFAFVSIFIPLIADETSILSQTDTKQLSEALHGPLSKVENLFAHYQQSQGGQQSLDQYVQAKIGALFNVADVSSFANSVVSGIGQAITAFFIISFFTFFFLRDGAAILDTLLLLVPPKQVHSVRNIIDNSKLMLSKYFTGVLIDVTFVSTFVGCGMTMLGIRDALIIGLFAGVMNIIPYVGPLIGGTFAILIGISTNLGPDFPVVLLPLVGKIVAVFVAMNLTDAFLVQPFIFSNSVKAHPIEIFSVILISGTLAGIGGMIAAVPVYTVLRIIARQFLSRYRFVQRLTDEMDEVKGMKDDNQNDHNHPI